MASHFMINWETQVHKGMLDLCVLNALASGPKHGYSLADLLRRHQGLAIAGGAIYRVLRRLKDGRLLKASVAKSNLGPRRLCYTVTEAGERMRVRMSRFWQAMNESMAAIGPGTVRSRRG